MVALGVGRKCLTLLLSMSYRLLLCQEMGSVHPWEAKEGSSPRSVFQALTTPEGEEAPPEWFVEGAGEDDSGQL